MPVLRRRADQSINVRHRLRSVWWPLVPTEPDHGGERAEKQEQDGNGRRVRRKVGRKGARRNLVCHAAARARQGCDERRNQGWVHDTLHSSGKSVESSHRVMEAGSVGHAGRGDAAREVTTAPGVRSLGVQEARAFHCRSSWHVRTLVGPMTARPRDPKSRQAYDERREKHRRSTTSSRSRRRRGDPENWWPAGGWKRPTPRETQEASESTSDSTRYWGPVPRLHPRRPPPVRPEGVPPASRRRLESSPSEPAMEVYVAWCGSTDGVRRWFLHLTKHHSRDSHVCREDPRGTPQDGPS